MRILNENEQDLCLRILNREGRSNYLGNILESNLEGACVSITKDIKKVVIEFRIKNDEEIPTSSETEKIFNRINEISLDILNAVNLINILEKEGYIMLLQRANQVSNVSRFGDNTDNLPCVEYHFADENISELLIKFVNKEIYVTEEFREFCKHKFIARDEYHFQKQFRKTNYALTTAIIALFVSIIFNLLHEFSGGTRIKQEQIDSLRTDLKTINSTLININEKTNQSLNQLIEGQKRKTDNANKKKKNASR